MGCNIFNHVWHHANMYFLLYNCKNKRIKEKHVLFRIVCDYVHNYKFQHLSKKICLYNYKIKTPDIDINSIDKPWWISDTLRVLENKHFLLDTEIEASDGSRVNFIVEFEFSETEKMFSEPQDKRTEDYITGRFG